MTYLSKNFTLEELCVTNTGLPNSPNSDEIEKLTALTIYILQPIRDKFGPIRISSAYRCDAVNQAVGGKRNSRHRLGTEADFAPFFGSLDEVFHWCIGNLKFGQVILEDQDGKNWIHIGLPREGRPNQQALIFKDGVYHPYTIGEIET